MEDAALLSGLHQIIDDIESDPQVIQEYQEVKAHAGEQAALAALCVAAEAAKCIANGLDLPPVRHCLCLVFHCFVAKTQPLPCVPLFRG